MMTHPSIITGSRTVLSVLVCLIAATGVFAQGGTATATMAGRITDDTQAVLPGVTVTVTNLATNQSRSAVMVMRRPSTMPVNSTSSSPSIS